MACFHRFCGEPCGNKCRVGGVVPRRTVGLPFTHALAWLLAIDRSRSCCASVLPVPCGPLICASVLLVPAGLWLRLKFEKEWSNGHLEAGEADRRCSFRWRNLRGLPTGDQPKKGCSWVVIDRDIANLLQASNSLRGSHVHACPGESCSTRVCSLEYKGLRNIKRFAIWSIHVITGAGDAACNGPGTSFVAMKSRACLPEWRNLLYVYARTQSRVHSRGLAMQLVTCACPACTGI